MCTLRIQHSLFFLPSLFFDGFAWILILCLIIDSRGFKKGTPDFKGLTDSSQPLTVLTLQSKVRSPSLFPELFLVIWTHKTSIRDKFSCDNTTDLPFPIVVDSIGGRGKTHSKDQTRLKFFYSKMMRVNWRSKMCKNHQITGFQSHHKSIIFRRSLLMFMNFGEVEMNKKIDS